MTNPFKVLGIDSGVAKIVPEETLLAMVKSQYKLLMLAFHPDRCKGNGEKAKVINEAYSQLEDPDIFALSLAEHTQSSREKRDYRVESLTAIAQKSERLVANAEEALLSFVRSVHTPDRQTQGIPEKAILPSIASTALRGVSLLVSDEIEGRLRGAMLDSSAQLASSHCLSDNWMLEFQVATDGSFSRRKCRYHPLSRKDPDPKTYWVKRRDRNNVGGYWQPVGEGKTFPGIRIVGGVSVSENQMEKGHAPNREFFNLLAPLTIHPTEVLAKKETGFTLEEFRPFLPFIRSAICRSAIIIAFQPEPMRFYALGSLVKFRR